MSLYLIVLLTMFGIGLYKISKEENKDENNTNNN